MRLVTVAATRPLGVHLALQERAVDVGLVQDLPIGVIQLRPQQRRREVIEKRMPGDAAPGRKGLAARVTRGADLDLGRRVRRGERDAQAAGCSAQSWWESVQVTASASWHSTQAGVPR